MYITEVVEPVEREMVGSWASLGSWDLTEFTRERMSARAPFGSVLSFMYTVMVDVPILELEVM